MTARYLAFDIETAKDVLGDDFNWRPHRPLGISCAATLTRDAVQPLLWHGKTKGGSPERRMSREDAQGLGPVLGEYGGQWLQNPYLEWVGL
jgi:hypothetical protein